MRIKLSPSAVQSDAALASLLCAGKFKVGYFLVSLLMCILNCSCTSVADCISSYQDLDLSLFYETKPLVVNFVKMEEESPHSYLQHFISAMSQIVEFQLSSQRIEEFMRFV
jgi:hypothetical protein